MSGKKLLKRKKEEPGGRRKIPSDGSFLQSDDHTVRPGGLSHFMIGMPKRTFL